MKWVGMAMLALVLAAGAGEVRAGAWETDYAKAKARAAAEHKPLLLDFTGSDWCGWCMKFDAEVFQTPAFKNYARKNLVLVKVDFPKQKELPAAEKAQNASLAGQYQVHSYPTLLLVSADGRELFRQKGYVAGGPAPFLKELQRASPPVAESAAADPFAVFAAKGEEPSAPAPPDLSAPATPSASP